jgi:DNA-binding response OmpR family regulator
VSPTRVLVVEDDERLARSIQVGLQRSGLRTDVCLRGDEGLRRALAGRYGVFVLDLSLPGLGGLELCRHLRETGSDNGLVVLTARDTDQDRAAALRSGADVFLTKPFSFPTLVASVAALARREPNETSRKSDHEDGRTPVAGLVAGLQPDRGLAPLLGGDTRVPLTSREFALLEYLADRAGSAVSSQELLRHVWPHFDGDPDIVEVYVRRLSRKLDERLDALVLQTMPGIGHRLTTR